MTAYVALLRAVNVGGTGKLPMSELRAIFEAAGFSRVETYIASGNVIFEHDIALAAAKAKLETALAAHAGKSVGVHLRTSGELREILERNPFPDAPPNKVAVIFLDTPPAADAIAAARGRSDEDIVLGRREIYVHYPGGMGASKLKLPAATAGTARNINTIAKLADMAAVR